MKARVIATGEIFNIASYATVQMECCDSYGRPLSFSFDEVEILSEKIESNVPDYWTRLEHQYAGMAMQGLMSYVEQITPKKGRSFCDEIVDISYNVATALVEKLKLEEKK